VQSEWCSCSKEGKSEGENGPFSSIFKFAARMKTHFSETAPLHHFSNNILILFIISVVQLVVQLWCSVGAVVVQSGMVLGDCTTPQI